MTLTETKSKITMQPGSRDLLVSRLINAPRELVWKAWTEPEHLINWWGPDGFTNTFKEFALKPGGVWRFTMHGPDGTDYPNKIVFIEVLKPEKLVYHHSDDIGEAEPAFTTTVTFEEHGNKTLLRMQLAFASAELRDKTVKDANAIEGANQTMNKLDDYVFSLQPFVISRVLNAPRELVWKVFSENERFAQWWGPKGYKVTISKMDFKPGGLYHHNLVSPDGVVMWGRFVYRKIEAPEKIVFIDSFSDEKGGINRHPMSTAWPAEMLTTFTFEALNNKTKLTVTWHPLNATDEERDTFLNNFASMTNGWTGTFEKLEEYLAKQLN